MATPQRTEAPVDPADPNKELSIYRPAKHRPAPAFQEYAADMLANEYIKEMMLPELGLLFLMRLTCWVSGRVPSDPSRLAKRLAQPRDHVERCLTDSVLAFFESLPGHPGFLHAPELTNYRKLLNERHEERSRSGRRGANAKWRKARGSGNGSADGSANGSLSPDQLSRKKVAFPANLEDDIPF